MFFSTNLTLYYLIPYQNLLRLNVIFMVKKKVRKMDMSGGCQSPPPPLPSTPTLLNFRAKMVGLKNIFMDRCPMDESTTINLACKKTLFPVPRKIGKTTPPPLAIAELTNNCVLLLIEHLQFLGYPILTLLQSQHA